MKEITQDHLIPFKDKEDDLAHYYCLYYLINILRINPIQRWASQKKLSEINIDDIINMIPDGNKRFIQNLKTTSIKYNFPILKEKISYIQDEDTCAFFYFYIMLHYRENNISDIESSATNTLERQHAIFRYFLYSKYISDEKKFQIINIMKQKWDEVSDINSKINFNWLDKTDENNCRIVWEYLYKNLPSFMFLYAPAPINNMERYLIIKAYFYAYTYMQSESDKLFHLQQIKKRITTARYREKKENEKKVLLQTYISLDAKKQLKYLANKLDTPICKLVEKLIKNVYMDYNDKV